MVLSLTDAVAIKAQDSHTYTANFPNDWTIGSVPHGGYITAVFMRVAKTHFATTLAGQKQPHTSALHLEFLKRTHVGPATFLVKDVKLGRQTSTIHITLVQDDRQEVIGYITNHNFAAEEGVSFPTGWELHPSRPAVDLRKLKSGRDEFWEEQYSPFPDLRKASTRIRFFIPRAGQALKSINDEWVCMADGSRFTQESIGYVADMWPQVIENYYQPGGALVKQRPNVGEKSNKTEARFWYATVLLNLDVKKALPEEGVEWLFARVQAKQIKNGRMDLEVIVMDDMGEIVALSHHVVMVLPVARNLAARREVGNGGAKI